MINSKSKRLINRDLLDSFRNKPCLICHKTPSDPCHIQSRGSGGPDAEWNLISLCRLCHSLQHSYGWKRMIERYPMVAKELKSKGWALDEFQRLRRA